MSLDFLKNILGLNKENDKKVESRYLKTIKNIKEKNHHSNFVLSGNLLWRQNITFKDIEVDVISPNGDIIATYFEYSGIPYRSCPLSLLEDSPFGDDIINLKWRESVRAYWATMNRKIKKGKIYSVIGNKNIDRILVEKITRSNVIGKYGQEPVKVPKLNIGDVIDG